MAYSWQRPRRAGRLGRCDSHQERTCQAGADGDGDGIGTIDPGGLAGSPHRRHDGLQVGAGGDFGYDSAEPGMLIDAGGDLVGEQLSGAVGHRTIPTPVSSQELSVPRTIIVGPPQAAGSRSGARRIMVYAASAPDG